jgi:hypothetical protein
MNNAKVKIQIEQAEIELTVEQIFKAVQELPLKERNWLKLQLDLDDSKSKNIITLPDDMSDPNWLKLKMKEQGYKGIDWTKVDECVKRLDIQEPIEELLKDLD